MVKRWIVAVSVSSVLAAALPAFAQSPMPKDAPPATSAAANPAPAPGDPNVSYPLANGGTYQAPLNGQGDPTKAFYEGYSRT